jgi:hypothetical protein
MKTTFISSIAALLVLATEVCGQVLPDSVKYLDHVLTMKKKAALVTYLRLSEAEKASFWPVFDSYQRATKNYEMESLLLISKYASRGSEYSPKEFHRFSSDVLKNDLEIAKIRRRYYKKFRAALSAERASAFMQFDENYRSLIRMDAQKDLIFLAAEVYSRN